MNNKPAFGRSRRKSKRSNVDEQWHNGADLDIRLYAQSLRKSARILVEKLDWNDDSKTAWDVAPIIVLYQQAIELELKTFVGEGEGFLPSPPDFITLYTTHSLRWLAQFVCRIIKTAGCEAEFKCDGIPSLADFNSLIGSLATMEPVSSAVISASRRIPGEVPEAFRKGNVLKMFAQLDALLDLLVATSDALAATKELQEKPGDGRWKTTIQ